MVQENLPRFDMEKSETQCCPRFDPVPWDGMEFVLKNRPFVRANSLNFWHIPLNLGSVIRKTWKQIQAADAAATDEFLLLSYDPTPWRGEHYFLVTKDVPQAHMVRISGHFLAKVFEGPYRDAGKWAGEMPSYVAERGRELRKLYFFYTSCPRCAKHYGKNYVVAFAEV